MKDFYRAFSLVPMYDALSVPHFAAFAQACLEESRNGADGKPQKIRLAGEEDFLFLKQEQNWGEIPQLVWIENRQSFVHVGREAPLFGGRFWSMPLIGRTLVFLGHIFEREGFGCYSTLTYHGEEKGWCEGIISTGVACGGKHFFVAIQS